MSKYNLCIVNKIDKKHKIINADKQKFPMREREYELEDVVFCDKKNISDCYLYEEAIDEIEKNRDFKCDNIDLLINKFRNKHSISYTIKKYCSNILKQSKIINYVNEQSRLLEKTSLYQVEKYEFSVMNKMMIGYGGTTTYNNDITLHPIYGIPYMPGQAIKGVLKHYISNYTDDPKAKILSSYLGDEDKKGDILFFDAYPKEDCEIVEDVMSVHHKDYYTSLESFPRDDDTTTVIKFLAVKGSFVIRLGICNKLMKSTDFDNGLLLSVLKDALYKVGIGGKTSVGYGILEFKKNI